MPEGFSHTDLNILEELVRKHHGVLRGDGDKNIIGVLANDIREGNALALSEWVKTLMSRGYLWAEFNGYHFTIIEITEEGRRALEDARPGSAGGPRRTKSPVTVTYRDPVVLRPGVEESAKVHENDLNAAATRLIGELREGKRGTPKFVPDRREVKYSRTDLEKVIADFLKEPPLRYSDKTIQEQGLVVKVFEILKQIGLRLSAGRRLKGDIPVYTVDAPQLVPSTEPEQPPAEALVVQPTQLAESSAGGLGYEATVSALIEKIKKLRAENEALRAQPSSVVSEEDLAKLIGKIEAARSENVGLKSTLAAKEAELGELQKQVAQQLATIERQQNDSHQAKVAYDSDKASLQVKLDEALAKIAELNEKGKIKDTELLLRLEEALRDL